MKRILITGATGNIGREVIHFLCVMDNEFKIVAAVRNIQSSKKEFLQYSNLSFVRFDFEDQNTFHSAFKSINTLFLLRPPHISQVEKYFNPLLLSAKKSGVEEIAFLSVQGAEKSSVIPHNKIERLIKSYGFRYVFIRPAYFMQNLTTILLPEILETHSITLPSGKAKFNWVDVRNIGEASAMLIKSFTEYQNSGYDITGLENKNFYEMAELIRDMIGIEIRFQSMNPISFYFKKRMAGIKSGLA